MSLLVDTRLSRQQAIEKMPFELVPARPLIVLEEVEADFLS